LILAIKQAHRWNSFGQHADILQRRAHNVPDAPLQSVLNSNKSRFHEDHFLPGVLDGLRDTAITSADIEEGAGRGEVSHRLENATISVLEPEG
jgi:hypothetical protein